MEGGGFDPKNINNSKVSLIQYLVNGNQIKLPEVPKNKRGVNWECLRDNC